MKFLKGLAVGAVVVLVLAVGLALAAPLLFGDEIRAAVDEQLDRYVDADVAYGDVGLSVLRDFPRLSATVADLHVEGRGRFDTVSLARVDELSLAVDFWSVVGEGPVAVRAVELVRPRLHVVTLADGTTNTDILRNLAEATDEAGDDAGGTSDLRLDRYAIVDGELIYDDRAGDVYAHVVGLDHEGSGDFSATRYLLETATEIGELSLKTGGVTYLRRAGVAYDADFAVDTEAETLTLADNALRVNELALAASGVIGFPKPDGSVAVDLDFDTPQQSFRALWSVVPAVFTRDLEGLETGGAFELDGVVEGTYEPTTGHLPSFAFDVEVAGGSVQYPDLPKALTDINVVAGIRSAGADLADLLVDVERFDFRLGANPFSGSLRVRQGTTDPAFDLVAEGTLDLADLAGALPLEGIEALAGTVALDVTAAGKASGVEADLRSVTASGLAALTDIVYEAAGTPAVRVATGRARFDGSAVELSDFDVRAGNTDLRARGVLRDPFALATETGTLTGEIVVDAGRIDANEWLAEPTVQPADQTAAAAAAPARPFERFDIDYAVTAERVDYDVYTLEGLRAEGSVSPERLALERTAFATAGSDVALSGQLDNLYGFAFDGEELTGSLQVDAGTLDLLALSSVGVDPDAVPDPAAAAEAEYIALPENMTIRVAAAVDELLYDGLAVEDVTAVIAMANQSATIENGRGRTLGGTVRIDGGYEYVDAATPPSFDLKYDIQGASFREAFEKLNTVQRLAPIAKYLEGNFSTNLVMSSTLGRDMLPRLQDLDADGFIATLDAALESFGPLQTISDKLGIKELRTLDLGNTKNWFTIEDGTVNVRPFDVKWAGIDATIGGSHGLDQAMDYEIVALVPRERLGKNAVGAAVNTGLDFLGSQASKLGLDLDAGAFVRVGINLTGSIDDPKVGIKLLGTEGDGSAKDAAAVALKAAAQQARDSVERLARARLDAAQAEATAKARAAADSVRNAAEARARAAAEEATAKARAEADRLAKKAADEAKARASEEAKRVAEEAAKKAGDDAKDKARDALKGIFGKKPD